MFGKEVKLSKMALSEMRTKRRANIEQKVVYKRHCLEWAKAEMAAFEAEIDLYLTSMAEMEPNLGALKVSDFNGSVKDDQLMVLLVWLCAVAPHPT